MQDSIVALENIDRVISDCLSRKRTLAIGASLLLMCGLAICAFSSIGPWVLLMPLFCSIALLLTDDEASLDEIVACRSALVSSKTGKLVICDMDSVFSAQSGRLMKSQVRAFSRLG